MRRIFLVAATFAALTTLSASANAQSNVFTGAAVGAGTGAIIGGPPGAVVGGIIGGTVGAATEPRPIYVAPRRHRVCWRDRRGVRHCRWR
jgi:hypothetical protein